MDMMQDTEKERLTRMEDKLKATDEKVSQILDVMTKLYDGFQLIKDSPMLAAFLGPKPVKK